MSRKPCRLTVLCTKEHHQRAHGARIKLAEALDPVGLRIHAPTPKSQDTCTCAQGPRCCGSSLCGHAPSCPAHAPLTSRGLAVAWSFPTGPRISCLFLETSAAKQWTDVGASGRIRNSLHFGTNFLASLQKRLCQKPCRKLQWIACSCTIL